MKENAIDPSLTKSQIKILAVFLIMAGLFGVCAAVIIFIEQLVSIEKMSSNAIYIKTNSLGFGMIFTIPMLIVFIYMVYLGAVDKFKDSVMKLLIKISLMTVLLVAVSSSMFYWGFSSKLHSNGYLNCHWYNSPSRGSPTIWVQSERFCQKRASNMTIKLFEYYDELNLQNTKPTDEALDIAITDIVNNKH